MTVKCNADTDFVTVGLQCILIAWKATVTNVFFGFRFNCKQSN